MADSLENGRNSLKEKFENFKNLDQNQKTIILAAFALVISTLVVITFWLNRVEYKVLYSNLSVKDASNINKILKDKKVPLKLENQGTTILVPADQVHQIRLELAGEGLPKNGNIGFEDMFGKPDFHSSEFVENLKYVRALQGELSKSINNLEAVEESQVNLSIPRRRIYLDENDKPTASVLLKLKNGDSLSNEEVRGIAYLVSGAVEGLKIDNVTIMSTDGKLLSEFLQESAYGATSYQVRIQKEMQRNLEKKINTLLSQILGEGKAIVKANVDLKLDQKEIKKVMYIPAKENVGVIRSTQTLMEDYQEAPAKKEAAAGTEISATTTTTAPPAQAQDPTKPDYRQRNAVTNYEVSQQIENERVSPGEVRKVSIGVMIDSETGIKQKGLESLNEVIASAAGIDKSRGDVLTVRLIKFQKTKITEGTGEAEETDPFKKYQKYLIPATAPIMLLIFAVLFLRKKKEKPEKGSRSKGTESLEGNPTRPMIDVVSSESPTDILAPPPMEEKIETENVRENVRRFARENPKAIARLLEQWMHEEAK